MFSLLSAILMKLNPLGRPVLENSKLPIAFPLMLKEAAVGPSAVPLVLGFQTLVNFFDYLCALDMAATDAARRR